jgi:hypothetical protein
LKQTAIDENPAIAEIEQVLGAGHRPGGAKKRNRRHRIGSHIFDFRSGDFQSISRSFQIQS